LQHLEQPITVLAQQVRELVRDVDKPYIIDSQSTTKGGRCLSVTSISQATLVGRNGVEQQSE